MIAGLIGLAAASVLFAFGEQLSWLFLARLVQGAADAVTWVVGFALVADLYGAADRGRIMGLVMAGSNGGFMVGPSLGGWLYEAGGIRLPFLLVALLALIGAVAFAALRLPAGRATGDMVPAPAVMREPAVLFCAFAVVMASATIAMLEPTVSLWLADDLALNPGRIGVLFGISAVASTALHPVYGRLADRWGGRRVTLIGLAATALVLPVLSRAWSFETAVVFYVGLAAAFSLVVTPSLAYMAEATSRAGAGSFGVAYGIYNFAWGTGLLVGPALGGFLFERLGFGSMTTAWGVLLGAVTLVLVGARRSAVSAPV
jgi:MFS family permease